MNVFGYLYNGQPIPIDGFAIGRAEPPAAANPLLRDIALTCVGLRRFFPHALLYITGHADHPDRHHVNVNLSQQRADMVAQELRHQGLPAAMIIITSQGDSHPVEHVYGRSERNRRVELQLDRQPRSMFRMPAFRTTPPLDVADLFRQRQYPGLPDPCTVGPSVRPPLCTVRDFTTTAPTRTAPNVQSLIEGQIDAVLTLLRIPSRLGSGASTFPLREAVRGAVLQQVDRGIRAAISSALNGTGFGAYVDAINSLINALRNPSPESSPDMPALIDGGSEHSTQPFGTAFHR